MSSSLSISPASLSSSLTSLSSSVSSSLSVSLSFPPFSSESSSHILLVLSTTKPSFKYPSLVFFFAGIASNSSSSSSSSSSFPTKDSKPPNKYSYILHSAYPYKFFRKLKNEIYKTDYDTYYAT